NVGGMLGLLDLLTPAVLVFVKCSRDGRRVLHGVCERDRILHRKLSARADREMCTSLGVAQQNHVALDPTFTADHRKITPHRTIDEEWVVAEKPAEDLHHTVRRLLFAQPIQSGALKRCGVGFKNPSRTTDLILISVGNERAPLGLLKNEREGVERPG